jgi:hypothetical protein
MIPYLPLNKAKNEIRVFVLLPDDYGEVTRVNPIRCRLEHVALDQATFAALSYVWGDSSENRGPLYAHYPVPDNSLEWDAETMSHRPNLLDTLLLHAVQDDELFVSSIGANLSWALLHLRKPHEEIRLWIDAVCINQEDNEEKSWQVELMASIYAQATTTIIWLGPNQRDDMDDLHSAGSVLLAVEQVSQHPMTKEVLALYGWCKAGVVLSLGENWLPHLRASGKELEDATSHIMAFGWAVFRGIMQDGALEKLYKNVEKLSKRPWFSRAWVVQEYSLARSVTWALGGLLADGDVFYIFIMILWGFWESCLLDTREVNNMRQDLAEWLQPLNARMTMVLLQRSRQLPPRLYELMCRLYLGNTGEQVEATDPRDKVFALLAMVDNTLGIKPNYNFSVEYVYAMTASRFIVTGQASLLSVTRPRENKLGLPSWVMDWSSQVEYPAKWMNFNASGRTKPVFVYPVPGQLSRPHLQFTTDPEDPEAPVNPVWIGHDLEQLGYQIVGRRIGLQGFRLSSVKSLGSCAENVFDFGDDDQDDVVQPETESIISEITAFRRANPTIDAASSDVEIPFFSLLFRRLRMWLSEMLSLADDNELGWLKVLDVAIHGGATRMDEDGRHSDLRTRIKSSQDLLSPCSWLTNTRPSFKLISDVVTLASDCRLMQLTDGRIGYAPSKASLGDEAVVLYGVPTPLFARKSQDGYFTIIGPAYAFGIMTGEEAMRPDIKEEMFMFE